MKMATTLLALFAMTFLYACNHNVQKNSAVKSTGAWVETTGKVTESSKMPDGTYAYTFTYVVTNSTAYNGEGKLIQGPLAQHYFGLKKPVINGQVMRLRYKKDDPMEHGRLDKIKYHK